MTPEHMSILEAQAKYFRFSPFGVALRALLDELAALRRKDAADARAPEHASNDPNPKDVAKPDEGGTP